MNPFSSKSKTPSVIGFVNIACTSTLSVNETSALLIPPENKIKPIRPGNNQYRKKFVSFEFEIRTRIVIDAS